LERHHQNGDATVELPVIPVILFRIHITMETIIKVSASELDMNLLNKIKEFIGKKENIDVTISLKEMDTNYLNDLSRSINQAEEENLISFTMEEFIAYKPSPNS
jgi:hypothetical protein